MVKDVFEISEHVLSVNIPYNPFLVGDKTSSDAQNDAQSLEDKIISLIIKIIKSQEFRWLKNSECPKPQLKDA